MKHCRIIFAIASCVLWVCLELAQAAPRLDKMKPHAVRRGEELRVEFLGADLLDPQNIVFYLPGIELIEWEALGPNRIAAVLRSC